MVEGSGAVSGAGSSAATPSAGVAQLHWLSQAGFPSTGTAADCDTETGTETDTETQADAHTRDRTHNQDKVIRMQMRTQCTHIPAAPEKSQSAARSALP